MIFQDTNINIRLSKRLKDKFVEVSKANGLSYSMVLRNMIKNYVEKGEYNENQTNEGGITW